MADADAMAGACAAAGVVFAGGALTKAYPEVQEAAARLAAGVYGAVVGASVHGWSSEILGAGCQHTSVLRLLTGAEVTAVVGGESSRNRKPISCICRISPNVSAPVAAPVGHL